MELIINSNPIITKQHLDHLYKYQNNYGIHLTKVQYEAILNDINSNKSLERCPASTKCYEIFVGSDYVGDLTVDQENEIDIAIFDEYTKKGFAEQAIRFFLNNYAESKTTYEAAIILESTMYSTMCRILSKVGFTRSDLYPNTELWAYEKE